MKRGFLGGLVLGGILTMAAKVMIGNREMKTPARWVRQSRQMMKDMEVDEWIGRGGQVARKAGRRILRSMSR
jgi:hypothetical protein